MQITLFLKNRFASTVLQVSTTSRLNFIYLLLLFFLYTTTINNNSFTNITAFKWIKFNSCLILYHQQNIRKQTISHKIKKDTFSIYIFPLLYLKDIYQCVYCIKTQKRLKQRFSNNYEKPSKLAINH